MCVTRDDDVLRRLTVSEGRRRRPRCPEIFTSTKKREKQYTKKELCAGHFVDGNYCSNQHSGLDIS